MYTESVPNNLPESHYTESELEKMYMGMENEARKRYQRQGSWRRQGFDRRQRSNSEMEMVINHTYTDLGQQMMILDIGAPVSIAGILWMTQYLEEFCLCIEEMKSVNVTNPLDLVRPRGI